MRIRNLRSKLGGVAVKSLLVLFVCGLLSTSTAVTATAFDNARSRAERALREGDFELAEKLFHEALAKDSGDNQARLGLSYTLYKLRKLADAYDHASRVIANDPLSARAHALLGTVILAGGDFRMSVEEFRTALSLN